MSAPDFYQLMGYASPLRSEFFQYQETRVSQIRPLQAFWSWLTPPDERMQMYITMVQKWQWIWKYVPGVRSVFLSNSMTFNALHEGSNINLFIVTTSKRLRSTRLCVSLVLGRIHVRHPKHAALPTFSADFLITEDQQDLGRFLLSPSDPYLVYWLAHLVPIYHRDLLSIDQIYEENTRLSYYLPNFPARQTIFLGIDVTIGTSTLQRRGEWYMNSLIGLVGENIVKIISRTWIRRRLRRSPTHLVHLVMQAEIYKAYDDKRKRYALKRELARKTQNKVA